MRAFRGVACFVAAGLLLGTQALVAQEQFSGLCAPVTIVLSQTLTIERIGFQATLQVTDNDPNNPITDFAANLTFQNPLLSTNGTVNDSSSRFFVQPPTFQIISAVDGTGVIQPGQTAQIGWFLIPVTNAGGITPNGIIYDIGANLSGQINGTPIPASALTVLPSPITVKPDAQLQITYFQPRDVIGMDPYTGLGSPIPFTFGVLVQNVGYGPATSVTIASQQPKIAQNANNLLLVAQLLGTRVNDSPLATGDLTVNLGNLQPGQAAKGAWDMIVTLSGTFLSVAASYTHSSALGGAETSLIKSVNAYLFLREVLDDQPGRDGIRDFLTDTSGTLDSVGNLIPDSLYESQGGVYPVNMLSNAAVAGSGPLGPGQCDSRYCGMEFYADGGPQPGQAADCQFVRSDGKVLTRIISGRASITSRSPILRTRTEYFRLRQTCSVYTYSVTYTNPPATTTRLYHA